MMTQIEILNYLEIANKLGITPNFWLTQEYLSIQDATLENNGKVMWIQEDDWAIFPPLPLKYVGHSTLLHENIGVSWLSLVDYPKLHIWSDFDNFAIGKPVDFLDWEYTYDANYFQNMEGSQWAVFRKNVRKWPRRNEGWTYSQEAPDRMRVQRLLIRWLEGRSEEIADSESLMHFVLDGAQRGFLSHKGELIGVNVWDSNEPYLMYRYCISDPGEPFLDEFTRLLFYQSVPNRLVIDGGVLNNPGLERFKDKLNPIQKRAVYSRSLN